MQHGSGLLNSYALRNANDPMSDEHAFAAFGLRESATAAT